MIVAATFSDNAAAPTRGPLAFALTPGAWSPAGRRRSLKSRAARPRPRCSPEEPR